MIDALVLCSTIFLTEYLQDAARSAEHWWRGTINLSEIRFIRRELRDQRWMQQRINSIITFEKLNCLLAFQTTYRTEENHLSWTEQLGCIKTLRHRPRLFCWPVICERDFNDCFTALKATPFTTSSTVSVSQSVSPCVCAAIGLKLCTANLILPLPHIKRKERGKRT